MESVLLKWGAVEVSAMDVYTDIFDLGAGVLQRNGEASGFKKGNPIIVGEKSGRVYRRIMFEDDFEDLLNEFQTYDWAILNGLTYWGKANTAANQHAMHAMIFDLDGQTTKTLANFLSGAIKGGAYPVPNYIILSGHNVHLYYLLEQPVELYPEVKRQMKELKYALIDRIWNGYTSTEKKVQHQGINQGFRIIGGKTKDGGGVVRAFKLSDTPLWLDQLNEFVDEDSQVDASKLWKESRLTLEEAAKKWPEWYEKRVLGNEPKGRWYNKEDLYNWWLRQIGKGVTFHHRYFCVMALAIFAVKCGIDDVERVKADAMNLLPYLQTLSDEDLFTEEDIDSALECLDERYVRFPRKDIAKISGITLPENKRNGRKINAHIRQLNATRKFRRDELGEDEYKNNGRPTKEQQIKAYARAHPELSNRQIAAALGVSRNTVNKWLKG